VSDEPKVCGAKTRNGGTCRKPPMLGRTRCKLHGGASLQGPAHPCYIDGRASRNGPLAQAADRVREQADLLDLRPGVALFDVRMEEIAERLEEKDTPGLRRSALSLLDEAIRLEQEGDHGEANAKLNDCRKLLHDGAERDAAWEKLLSTQERRSDRAEKAQDRWLKQAEVFHVGELQAAVTTMLEVLVEHAPRDVVAKVTRDLEVRLLGG
jgi:hypothetical protein